MINNGKFEISVILKDAAQATQISVQHTDETFSLSFDGKTAIILNNGDNSWSLVEGELDQLSINLIGDGIEKFYKEQGW